MKKTFLFCLTIVIVAFSACSNDDDYNDNNNQNQFEYFLKIDDTEYELKTGTMENYGEYQPGIYNFDVVLFTSAVNSIGGELVPQDQIFSGIYFELFTDNEEDLAVGTYNQVSPEDLAAQTFEYSEIAENVEIENGDETGTFSDLIQGSINVISNGPEYEFEFSGVDDLGRNISGYYKGSLLPVY